MQDLGQTTEGDQGVQSLAVGESCLPFTVTGSGEGMITNA